MLYTWINFFTILKFSHSNLWLLCNYIIIYNYFCNYNKNIHLWHPSHKVFLIIGVNIIRYQPHCNHRCDYILCMWDGLDENKMKNQLLFNDIQKCMITWLCLQLVIFNSYCNYKFKSKPIKQVVTDVNLVNRLGNNL